MVRLFTIATQDNTEIMNVFSSGTNDLKGAEMSKEIVEEAMRGLFERNEHDVRKDEVRISRNKRESWDDVPSCGKGKEKNGMK
jgi:predicted RNA-binding protein with PIN domain